ncbi:MAG: hypothetical protein OXQ29_16795 [Rhodospirillaceae bacterium]|nr:hypothetical protein [Rhodospirillaceae bacterium]
MELTSTNLKPFLPGLEAMLDYDAVFEMMLNGSAAVIVERAGLHAGRDLDRPPAEREPATDPIINAPLADRSDVPLCSPDAAPATTITAVASAAGPSPSKS